MTTNNKFQQKLRPVVKKIKDELPEKNGGSMRSLAEILLAWYERKLTERRKSQ